MIAPQVASPSVLFTDDLAALFKMKRNSASKALRSGRFGPVLKTGKRFAVLRESFFRHLQKQQCDPQEADSPGAPRFVNREVIELRKP